MAYIHISAFYADGSEKLGNLDGQALFEGTHYQCSSRYKQLFRNLANPHSKVAYYEIGTSSDKFGEVTMVERVDANTQNALPHPIDGISKLSICANGDPVGIVVPDTECNRKLLSGPARYNTEFSSIGDELSYTVH